MTLPAYQTASGCTDIMMHTMERYFTVDGNMEITDAIAEALMKTVMKCAVILRDRPNDYDARAEVMWAGSLSHNGLTGCGNGGDDFASHRLEHEIGGMFDVTHGAGLAALWPSWARYVCGNIPHRFARFAQNVMGVEQTVSMTEEDTAMEGIARMEAFFQSIGMPVNMHQLGIEPTGEQILEMTEACVRANGPLLGKAKKLTKEDICHICMMAR